MFSLKNSRMLTEARGAQRKPKFIFQLLLYLLVFYVTTSASSIILLVPMIFAIFSNPAFMPAVKSGNISEAIAIANEMPTWLMLLNLFVTLCTTVLCIVYCRYIERRSLASMGFTKKGWLVSYLKGFLIGSIMLFACAGILYAMGALDFSFAKKIPVFYILAFLLGFLVQGMSEEVMTRGYFMMSLSNRCHIAIAVAISSVVFSLMHLGNPGIKPLALLNIALFGCFMAVYMLRTDDIWGASAIHSAWNFMQGNFLGIQVSGTGHLPSVAVMQPMAGKELLNGGNFGIEGGLIVTAVTLLAIALTLFLPKRSTEVPTEQEA